MSAFLALSLVGFASIAILLTTTSAVLFRMGVRPLAYWMLGWSALLEAGFVTLLIPEYPAIEAIGPLFSTFVAPFMLLGACAHAERTEPTWLVPAGFFLGALRASGYLLGASEYSISIAMATEPMLAAAAAWVILHPRREPASPLPINERILAIGFLLYGAVEFFDATSRQRVTFGWRNWIAWVSVGLPLAMAQISVHLDRLGRSARRYRDEARTSEIRLRALAESTAGFLAEFDEHGVLTFVSQGATAAAGHPGQSLLGRNIADFLHANVDSRIANALRERGRIGPEDVEAESGAPQRAILPDGSERWFDFSVTSYLTSNGELRILARIRDVTDQALAQERLRKSEGMLKRAEQIVGIGSWELDLRTGRLALSEAMYRLHGLPPSEAPLELDRLSHLIHPDDAAAVLEAIRSAPSSGRPIEHVYRILRADDGRIVTLRTHAEADFEENGDLCRLVGVSVDITNQLELAQRLKAGQERFQSIVDSSIVSVFFASRDGLIREANDAFLSPLGYTKTDLPLSWQSLTAAEFREQDDRLIAEGHRLETPRSFEKEFVGRDGRRIAMLLTCAPHSSDTAILLGVDLSARKEVENFRARQRRELEELIAARTRELSESQTRLAEHERLAAVGTLAAGVAHQINNPIGAILNCAEYALLCRNDEDARETFERALRDNLAEARRCAQIVRNMLQFSRDQPTAKWVEDLGRVVRRAQRAINAYAKDRGARLAFSTPEQNLLVRISPIELEQAIVNVLRNAIESRSHEARVSLLLTRRDKSAVLEITDDGQGIEPENLERLFEPFYSTRTREGGTGLGLSVAHGIILDHGGQIRVDSVPGIGTRVVISLPIEDASTPPPLAGSPPD